MKKIKIIIEIILIVSILILAGMIAYDYYDMEETKKDTGSMINEIDEIIVANKESDESHLKNNTDDSNVNTKEKKDEKKTARVSGCVVYGKIRIDKIGIEYPIIEYASENSLWKSICKISSNDINGKGNLCLAGHNMRNFSMFGNLRKVDIGDTIVITNLNGEEYVYKVYEKTYVNPDQTEVLKDTDEAIVTLVTCNDASNKRLIVKGISVSGNGSV